jgi:3-hydroxy-9,10-secoandrosta-1,3,5(10)-triene-9,17-dione monooxygenase reductase component
MMRPAFSQRELRDAFGTFATGVTVVTAVRPDGEPVGTTANSFTSVSLDPPLLLWCIATTSTSIPAFNVGAPFAVHVLSHQQRDLAVHFARKDRAKFEVDRHWRVNPHPPLIADSLCRFDCRVHAVYPGGDHLIIVGEVTGLTRNSGTALTFHAGRFGALAPDTGAARLDPWGDLGGEWL